MTWVKNKMEPSSQEHVTIRTETQHMSDCVFMCMCRKVGVSSVVAMRRDMMDIFEMLHNEVDVKENYVLMTSGSYREGFRLEGSDIDVMIWPKDHRVIWDLSQTQYYHSFKLTQILADCSESPPGFALLQLLMPATDETVMNAGIRRNGKLYLSSSVYREMKCSAYRRGCKIHGPCITGLEGCIDFDAAHCFVSDIWPPPASSWIERCHSWPPSHIVKDIVKGGCHFVAIGHKQGNHENNEWRISFSLAEKNLVYSMNSYQLLTYGLLKLFLKEVINNTPDENKLLCSYHMKTAVFWAIQNNTIPCLCPRNFLEGFWVCFKLILKWVYEGCCPNFFIPENNMFLTNIFGAPQRKLFFRLNALYEKGLSCLLECSTIRSYIFFYLCNRNLDIYTDENIFIPEGELDIWVFREVGICGVLLEHNLSYYVKVLHWIEQVMVSPLKECQFLMLQRVTVSVLQNTAFIFYSSYKDLISQYWSSNVVERINRRVYIADRISLHMLKFAAKFGCISDMLYIVMYYYMTCRYTEALSLLKMIKVKLSQPCLMHNVTEVPDMYSEAARGHTLTMKMRKFLVPTVRLYNKILYINELMIEQYYSLKNNKPFLNIPPFVLLSMLEFLCYKHVDPMSSQAALDDLQLQVHQGQGVFLNEYSREISWQILGICQQISGNYQAALCAYYQSLKADSYQKIQRATLIKILGAIAQSR